MSKKNRQKDPFLSGDAKFALSVVALGLLILSVIIFFGKADKTELSDMPEPTPIEFNTDNQTKLGKEDAPIQVVEFFDFQCPHCQDWNAGVFPGLKEKYIDTDKIEYVAINFPFLGADSDMTALMFETIYANVSSEKAFEFKKQVMSSITVDNKKPEDVFTNKNLLSIAKDILTSDEYTKVEKSFNDKEFKDAVISDKKIGTDAGVQGTPSIYINGVYFPGGMNAKALFKELESLSK